MKRLKKILWLKYTIDVRNSDLWKYDNWKKTAKMQEELRNELNALLVVKAIKGVKNAVCCG